MGVEIEKKYRLDEISTARIVELLAEFGAESRGEEFEENSIFGGGVLDRDRAVLRIRKTPVRTLLTYKRRIPGIASVKQQVEFETEIADASEIEQIVAHLGFEARVVYEKRRRTWKFREVEVVLDELPFGLFMEIEGSLTAIGEAEMLLEAEELEIVHETYPALTANLGKRIDGRVEARFED